MTRVPALPALASARIGLALLLATTLAGCGQADSENVRPLTLLFTGAVGGKIEPCG